MDYKATAFSEKFDRGRLFGKLNIQQGRMVFSGSSGEFSMTIDQALEVKSSGSGGRIIYFSRPDNTDLTFCTPEKAILTETLLQDIPAVIEVKKLRSRAKKIMVSVLMACAAVLAVMLYLLFAPSSPAIRYAAEKVPFQWEKKLGDSIYPLVMGDSQFIDDKNIKLQLKIITDPLVNVIKADRPEYTFDFYIADNPQVNAFALPGGKVVINSGLIEKSDSPEEIAGVLAHELAHVTSRHHIRSIIKTVGVRMLVAMVLGDFAWLDQYGSSLVMLKNSRTFEYEADRVGLKYINSAGIDSKGMISFFEKLDKEHDKSKDIYKTLNLFSTHPPTIERIEKLNDLAAKNTSNVEAVEFSLDFKQFKRSVAAEAAKK